MLKHDFIREFILARASGGNFEIIQVLRDAESAWNAIIKARGF